MAKERQKSINDLYDQMGRINELKRYLQHRDGQSWQGYLTTENRAARAEKAFDRYGENMKNSKAGKRLSNQMDNAKGFDNKFDLWEKRNNKKFTGYQDASTTRAVASTNG